MNAEICQHSAIPPIGSADSLVGQPAIGQPRLLQHELAEIAEYLPALRVVALQNYCGSGLYAFDD